MCNIQINLKVDPNSGKKNLFNKLSKAQGLKQVLNEQKRADVDRFPRRVGWWRENRGAKSVVRQPSCRFRR